MTQLSTVLERVYADQSDIRPLVRHPLNPEPGWIRDVLMIKVLRVESPAYAKWSFRTDIARADVARVRRLFEVALWDITLGLCTTTVQVTAEVLQILETDHQVRLNGPRKRSLRVKAATRVAQAYAQPGVLPGDAVQRDVVEDLRRLALRARAEWLDERTFVERMTPRYATLTWHSPERPPADLWLGTLNRPPLWNPAYQNVAAGTDRDCYSRYKSYYDPRSRSRTGRADEDRLDRMLAETPTESVAAHELARVAQPYGLNEAGHRDALVATVFAFSGVELPDDDGGDEGDAEVDGSPELVNQLARSYAGFALDQVRQGRDPTRDLEQLQQWVMRKLWNDCHRRERETESAGTRRWYRGKFRLALTLGAQDMGSDGARRWRPVLRAPADPLKLAFRVLAEQDAPTLHDWAKRAVTGEQPAELVDATRAVCRRRADPESWDLIAKLAFRALKGISR